MLLHVALKQILISPKNGYILLKILIIMEGGIPMEIMYVSLELNVFAKMQN